MAGELLEELRTIKRYRRVSPARLEQLADITAKLQRAKLFEALSITELAYIAEKGRSIENQCGDKIIAKGDILLADVEGRAEVACRELVVQTGGQRRYFLYTYRCGDSYTGSFWKQQLTIFANGLLSRNASGALIRVSTPVGHDVSGARQRAMSLLSAAVPHLDRALP